MTPSNPPAASAHQESVVRTVRGRGVPVRGDDIDTDRIVPARFLRCVTFEGIGANAFADDRAQAGGSHPFDQERFRGASVLVVNRNFGCGSSREHAPQSLMRWGIRALIGASFAEIFFGNCVALGIPCVVASREDVEAIQAALENDPDGEVVVDLAAGRIQAGGREFAATLPAAARESFLHGTWDAVAALLRAPEAVDAVAGRLPYLSGFARP